MQSPCHFLTVANHVDRIAQKEFLSLKKEFLEILSSRFDTCNILNVVLFGLDCHKLGGGDFSSFMTTLSK